MRMMMKVQMDTEAGSKAVADGSLPQLMQDMLGRLEPESAYFGPEDGVRTAFIVFDFQDPSQLPAISEPILSKLEATIRMFPVMNREDLQRAFSRSRPNGLAAWPRAGRAAAQSAKRFAGWSPATALRKNGQPRGLSTARSRRSY